MIKLDPAFRMMLLLCFIAVTVLVAYNVATLDNQSLLEHRTHALVENGTLEQLDLTTYLYTHYEVMTGDELRSIKWLESNGYTVVVNDYSIESLNTLSYE